MREADAKTLIVTDGFSCREQIAHATPRHAMHLAEVIQMALRQSETQPTKKYIESGFVQEEPSYPLAAAGVGAGLILAAGILLFRQKV